MLGWQFAWLVSTTRLANYFLALRAVTSNRENRAGAAVMSCLARLNGIPPARGRRTSRAKRPKVPEGTADRDIEHELSHCDSVQIRP
jgi:hypothetical protein